MLRNERFTGPVQRAWSSVVGRRPWSTGRVVVLAAAVVVLVRLAYLGEPLHPDEAGYRTVARTWHLGGPNLYGHYWVDRPPGLIALFKLGSLFPGDHGIRLVALPFVALFVASAGWAGEQVTGPGGGRLPAVLGAAFLVSPALSADMADGELFAAPLVMLAAALTLSALRSEGARRYVHALLAGLVAALAVMVKQNFVDGVVFAVALLVASLIQRRITLGRALGIGASGMAGGFVVVGAAAAYALVARVGIAELWFDVFRFRSVAFDVIEDHDMSAPLSRAAGLLMLALVSAVLPLLFVLGRSAWRARWRGRPVAWAVGVTLVVEVLSIAAGGSYWPHYLLQVTPMLTLAVAVGAGRWPSVRRVAAAAVVSALVSTVGFVTSGAAANERYGGPSVGHWLAASSRAGDTATVLYGHAEVQEASGLPSPYPHLWTLPMRTLDPRLSRLRRLIAGPAAPTWAVVWTDLNAWGIDANAALQRDLARHYRIVRQVCGHDVWLHDGVTRRLAPSPAC